MLRREARSRIRELLRRFPAVALVGPRQAGKTTLARGSDGHEVDLVLELDGLRWAIEIKLTTSPGRDDFARLAHAAGLLGADRRVLLSRAARTVESAAGISTNLPGLLSLLAP